MAKEQMTVHWKSGGVAKSVSLGSGRYYIGNSPHATICLDEHTEKPVIIGILSISDEKTEIKCVSQILPMHYKGQIQKLSEVIKIGLSAQIIVGRSLLRIERVYSDDEQTESKENKGAWTHGDPNSLRAYVSEKLLESLKSAGINLEDLDSLKVRSQIRTRLKEVIGNLNLSEEKEGISEDALERQVFDEAIGLGPLEELLSDKNVNEIMVNSFDQIYVERSGNLTLSEVQFSSEKSLLSVIERIVSTVGRRIDASSPICDARLLDGSRVNAVIQPIALKGACLTIRRFPEKAVSPDDLVKWKSVTPFMKDFFELCVHLRLNIIISGGTGSGKTTLLNALSGFIPHDDRIITVEDAAELQLQQPHVISLEARPPNLEGKGAITIRDLVKNCLRMRPDRIVVGECRGGEALDMLQAMNTGHDGSLSTAHANTPSDMMRRLETMVLMAGVDFPLTAIREQVASAVHLIIQQTRLHSGRRLVTEVAQIKSLDRETGNYVTETLIKFNRNEDSDQGTLVFYPLKTQVLAKQFGGLEKLMDLYKKHHIESVEVCEQ